MYKNITAFEDIVSRMGYAKLSDLMLARAAFENWYDLAFKKMGLRKEFVPRVRSGKAEIDERRHIATFRTRGMKVRFFYSTKGQLVDAFYTFAELFERDDYRGLNVKGRQVVDVGANIGDSAIYFAVAGAKHVYAFEPYPFACRTARRNVALNGLRNVTVLNEGGGAKDGTIRIKPEHEASIGSVVGKSERGGKLVRIRSLDTITKMHRIRNGALKLDCEGCEYGLILKAGGETLRRFDRIIIEYHFGYLNLKRKLEECGFTTTHTFPRIEIGDRSIRIGLLLAVKARDGSAQAK